MALETDLGRFYSQEIGLAALSVGIVAGDAGHFPVRQREFIHLHRWHDVHLVFTGFRSALMAPHAQSGQGSFEAWAGGRIGEYMAKIALVLFSRVGITCHGDPHCQKDKCGLHPCFLRVQSMDYLTTPDENPTLQLTCSCFSLTFDATMQYG